MCSILAPFLFSPAGDPLMYESLTGRVPNSKVLKAPPAGLTGPLSYGYQIGVNDFIIELYPGTCQHSLRKGDIF